MYRQAILFLKCPLRNFRIIGPNRTYCWVSIDMPSPQGYTKEEDEPDIPLLKRINGFRDVFHHFKMYGQEYWENVQKANYRRMPPEHEDILMEFDFKQPGVFERFLVTSDSVHKMGHSVAFLDKTKNGTALFHGNLDTTPVKDGKVDRSGFAALGTRRKKRSFNRTDHYEWNSFTHLLMKIRGDGRVYAVTLGCPGEVDIEFGDVFAYPLYTHGGPYWQFAMIPFSKFILTVNGRIPERAQRPLMMRKDMVRPQHNISTFGITLMDRHTGPFQLEIDWAGVYHDATNFEEWAYEKYKTPIPI